MARVLQLRRGTTAENNLFTGAVAEATYDTDRKELRIHDGSTVGGKVVSVPTGAVVAFSGSSAPEGWLICDGSAVSRTTYADLFAVIGTTYGDGDGNSTFNLPDKNYYTGAVKGNGFALGLTDGTNEGYYTNWIANNQNNKPLSNTNIISPNVPASYQWRAGVFGINTDSSKSGIVVEPDTQISMIIKY